VAGAAKMNRRRFMLFNIVGAMLWGIGITSLGYILGSRVKGIDKYILPSVVLAMLFAFSPSLLHISHSIRERHRTKAAQPKSDNQ
jgi:membrane-associated protein